MTFLCILQLRLLVNIFHPNINIDGKICLKMLDPQHWVSSTTMIQSNPHYILINTELLINPFIFCCFFSLGCNQWPSEAARC